MKKALAFLFITLFLLGAVAMVGCEADEDLDFEEPMEDTEY